MRGLPSAKRKTQRDLMMVGGREGNTPTVAVVAEFVQMLPTSSLWWLAQGFTVGVAESNNEWNKIVED